MKIHMKRILAVFLSFAMVVTGLYITDHTTVKAAEESNENTKSDDNTESPEVLESLGFDLAEIYDTDQLNPGNHAVSSMEEVCVELFGTNPWVDVYDYDLNTDVQKLNEDAKKLMLYNQNLSNWSLSISFDGNGDGKKEYIARLTLEDGNQGGRMLLSVFKAEYSNPEENFYPIKVFTDAEVGGYIVTDSNIPLYSLQGLMNLVAGDFDGDGVDELAVYAPNNSDEVESAVEPWTPNKLEVKIYDIDVNSNTLPEPTQVINIADGTQEWTWSSNGGTKEYYCIPYLSMTADDVNGDGVDDLMTVANFAEKFRGFQNGFGSYTWKEVLDLDNCFISVLDVYEGARTSDKKATLQQTVAKRNLVGKVDDECAYVLRNATAIVANVTGANSREIVLGGNYTRVEYTPNSTINSKVAETREIGNKDHTQRNIIGFTTYGNLKKDTTSAASLQYTWARQNGNANKIYQEAIANVDEPVALAGFAAYGSAMADTLFLEGQLFTYNNGEGKLESPYSIPKTVEEKENKNRWITSVSVGNVTNSAIGEETLYYAYHIRRSDLVVTGRATAVWGTMSKGETGYTCNETGRLGEDVRCSVYMVDIDNDSSFITFEEGDVDIYYGNVEVLSVLQAAPTWKELGDYGENGETSWAKTKGTGSGQSNEVTVSAGVVVGFEQEVSFLGLFKVAGMEFEASIVGSVGYTGETSTSKEFTTAYNTDGTDDVAVIFTVPYVRYNCQMYIPTYTVPTEAEYNAKKAFAEELKKHLYEYVDTNAGVTGGTYSSPSDGYNDKYTTDVISDNYEKQLTIYQNYVEWLEMTEATISGLGGGGEYTWGQEIEGGWEPYYYCIPQTPILTTVNVDTYDAIATANGKQTIYGNVFSKDYRAGDPSSYAKNTSELKIADGDKVLTGKTNNENSTDTDGFITSTSISASTSTPSQSISVSKENAQGVTYGVAQEMTVLAQAGGAKVGATASVEYNGSSVWTTTEGCEFTGSVPNLPSGTSNDYSYSWKLVSYTTKLNGKEVPVVGYLTKLNQTPPPSVPEDLTALALDSERVELQWSDGDRAADYYEAYRVTYSNGKTYYDLVEKVSENEMGIYSCIDNGAGMGLDAETTYSYVVKACYNSGIKSTYSETASATTLPKEANLTVTLTGMDSNAVCLAGRNVVLSAEVVSDSNYVVRSYKWQCNKGSGWKDADGINDESTYTFRSSTLKNGYRYRCLLEIRIGNGITGPVYELYSNTITQQARRVGTSIRLSAVKTEGAEDASTGYGPANGDSLQFSAQVVPEAETDTTGTLSFEVTYQPEEAQAVSVISATAQLSATESARTNTTVTTYPATVQADGTATAEISFAEPGKYYISAIYDGNEDCEGSTTEEQYSYLAYAEEDKAELFDFSSVEIRLDSDSYGYIGEQICPEISVIWNQTELEEGVDYSVSYGTNTDVGENAGTVTVTPMGNFENQDAKTISFNIEKGTAIITTDEDDYTVMLGSQPFSLNVVTNVNAGLNYTGYDSTVITVDEEGVVTPVGIGTTEITIILDETDNYNTTEKVVRIEVKGNIEDAQVTFNEGEVLKDEQGNVYVWLTGEECRPTVTVTYNGIVLEAGTDYILFYKDNSAPGTAVIQIAGSGDVYEGMKTISFLIKEGTPPSGDSNTPGGDTTTPGGDTTTPGGSTTTPGGNTTTPGGDTTTPGGNTTTPGGDTTTLEVTLPKKGDKLVVEGATYKVVTATAQGGTVSFASPKKNAKTVTIPATIKVNGITYKVTAIEKNAFKKNKKVTKVTIGANVKTIGTSAFEGCTKLSKVTIGKSATTIGDKAFKGCKALKNITVSGKVTSIGKEAFRNCSKLSKVTIKSSNLKKVGKNVFKGIKATAKIKVPKKKLSAYKKLLKGKGQGKKVKITK